MQKSVAYILLMLYSLLITPTGLIGQDLIINEVAFSNKTGIQDKDGNTPDWIELYNRGNNVIDLKGYMLTDDTTRTTHWKFPDIELPSGAFLVVFASGKNKVGSEELHTDFRLKQMHEIVYLINPENELTDKTKLQCVPADKSLGRIPDGSSSWQIMTTSAGSSNNHSEVISIDFIADTLSVNLPSGLYKNAIHLNLTNNHPENKIYYTLNGEDPDIFSEEYNESIYLEDYTPNENRFANKPETGNSVGDLIFKANVLKAQVFSGGCPASNIISNTYFINPQIDNRYNVPIVSLITEKDNLFDNDIGIYVWGNHNNFGNRGKEWERPVHIEMFDSAGKQFLDQDAGMRIHGRASRGGPQKSLRLYARDEYGKDRFNHAFFSQKPHLDSFKTILLRSTEDWAGTIFKDELCQHIVDDMDIDYTASNTVITFINGEYWGIYSLRERQDEYYVSNNYNIAPPEMDVIAYTPGGLSLESGDMDAYNELIEWIDFSDPQSENFYEEANSYFDISAIQEYYVAQLFLANIDFPGNNLKLWRIKSDTAKWRVFFFDLDGSMYRTKFDHLTDYNNLFNDTQRYPDYSTKIFKTLLNNPQFRKEFAARYYYHLKNTFNTNTVLKLITEYEQIYDPLVAEHTYRWHTPYDYLKWKGNLDALYLFCVERPVAALDQLSENFDTPVKIYPTITNSGFFIDYTMVINDNPEIEIFALSGQKVFSKSTSSNNQKEWININLPPSVYIVKIYTSNMIYSERIIVE